MSNDNSHTFAFSS